MPLLKNYQPHSFGVIYSTKIEIKRFLLWYIKLYQICPADLLLNIHEQVQMK